LDTGYQYRWLFIEFSLHLFGYMVLFLRKLRIREVKKLPLVKKEGKQRS
jgi:hypothetical protein